MVESTIDKYSGYMRRYVFAVLRYIKTAFPEIPTSSPAQPIVTEGEFPFLLRGSQINAALALLKALDNVPEDEEKQWQCLHEFLFRMMHRNHPLAGVSRFNCTTTRVIMILQIDKSLSLTAEENISGSIAALQWDCRTVFMEQIRAEAKANLVDGVPNYVA